MKLLLLFLTLFSANMSTAQQKNTLQKDPETGEPMMKGEIVFADLLGEPAYTWMSDAEGYKPNPDAIATLSRALPSCNLIVVMGTWCSDSHLTIPQLYSVLSSAAFPMENLTLYGADRDKEFGEGLKEKYGIVSVPTIIVLKNGAEKGRITETVNKSVEEDLAEILSNRK